MAWTKLAFDGEVVKKADFAAKGDVLSASAAATPLILTVGANDLVLTADSAEATGLKWSASGTGDFLADGTVPMTGNLDFDQNQATAMVLDNQATAPATPVAGQVYYDTATDDVWISVL